MSKLTKIRIITTKNTLILTLFYSINHRSCLLYTSDAADEL